MSTLNFTSLQIKPDTLAVLWLTDDQISSSSKGFNEFNYLTNGLLSIQKRAQSNKQAQKQAIYTTKSFGEDFYLLHRVVSSPSCLDQLGQLLDLLKESEKKDILVFNNSKNTAGTNVIEKITSLFESFRFIHLHI